ncbi:MAG: UV DNA damage repair endonuclease UvsE, partial [Candidatus Omnitrophica bacterium]|nr:UV DNA damage repair endonuclease UvsE [Candidatus Omnitrophota bacterium]
MIRLGLCCLFISQPIKFRTTTATHIARLPRPEQLKKLSALCLANAHSLRDAIEYCGAHHIGCFRINSQFWP